MAVSNCEACFEVLYYKESHMCKTLKKMFPLFAAIISHIYSCLCILSYIDGFFIN